MLNFFEFNLLLEMGVSASGINSTYDATQIGKDRNK